MSIKVCAIGIVSAIGIGRKENLQSLIDMRSGIGTNRLFDSSIDVPVGQIEMSNDQLKELLAIPNSRTISRTALLGAIAAKEALAEANIPSGKRIGLINSTTVGGMDLSEEFYRRFLQSQSQGRLRDIVGHDCSSSTDFIAQECGITGFRTTISTACSSAANAIIMGARMLQDNMLDYVLVGGVDSLCRFTLCGFNSLMILDSEPCRPFDHNRAGLNLGEGAGYIILTRDPEAKSYCTLSGYANANDAFHQTASSSDGDGAFMAMREALGMANLLPEDIDYINLHGTGTQNNDMSESIAIKRLYKDKNVSPCSTTKGYTGHTLAAAGGIEAIFSILSIEYQVRFACLRVDTPIEGGVSPILQTQQGVRVNHVLSNSFGFGGNCSTLIFSK